jgi:hypothetical protein
VLQLIRDLILSWKMGNAAREHSTGDSCVACDSNDVTMLAPQAYRCNKCGHEGGDGYASWQQGRREEAIRRMPPEKRRAGARMDLVQARDQLNGVIGDLHAASTMSALDIAGFGGSSYAGTDGEGGEKQKLVTTATQGLLEARNLVDDARVKLGIDMDTSLAETDKQGGYALWAADLHFDGLLVDLAYHAKIERMNQETRSMLEMVEEVLRKEFGWEG